VGPIAGLDEREKIPSFPLLGIEPRSSNMQPKGTKNNLTHTKTHTALVIRTLTVHVKALGIQLCT